MYILFFSPSVLGIDSKASRIPGKLKLDSIEFMPSFLCFLYLLLLCVGVGWGGVGHVNRTTYLERSEDNFWGSQFFPSTTWNLGDQTQVVRFDGRCLYC